ncbi:hypothetical protein D3C87_1604990 [compost metagenome]
MQEGGEAPLQAQVGVDQLGVGGIRAGHDGLGGDHHIGQQTPGAVNEVVDARQVHPFLIVEVVL